MANTNKPNLLFFIFFSLIWSAQSIQGSRIRTINPNPQPVYHHSGKQDLQGSSKEFGESIKMKGRRMMIGSVAPTCTYNECRGCKFRCRAQQVPVEGNDPIHSSYRYKCICQKY